MTTQTREWTEKQLKEHLIEMNNLEKSLTEGNEQQLNECKFSYLLTAYIFIKIFELIANFLFK